MHRPNRQLNRKCLSWDKRSTGEPEMHCGEGTHTRCLCCHVFVGEDEDARQEG